MRERRRHSRRRARLVLGIDTDAKPNRAGLTIDVSPSGMSFRSTSRFTRGDVLKLRFRNPRTKADDVQVFGRVVHTRVEAKRTYFPNVVAVAFRGNVEALS